MKRFFSVICVLALSLCLAGCTSGGGGGEISDLHMAISANDLLFYPDAAQEEGYYEVVDRIEGGGNILYTDYATQTRIYLCSAPNCTHDGESCTSWLDPAGGGARLFLLPQQKKLYVIRYGTYGNGSTEPTPSRIVEMGLDGSAPRTVVEFGFNDSIYEAVAANDSSLFLTVTRMEKEQEEPVCHLEEIRLADGSRREVAEFSLAERVMTAFGDQLIIEEALDDRVDYKSFSLNTHEQKVVHSTPYFGDTLFFQGQYLYIVGEDKSFSVKDLATGETRELASSLPLSRFTYGDISSLIVYYYKIFDDHLFFTAPAAEGETRNEEFSVDLKTGALTAHTLTYRGQKGDQPMRILAENEEEFLIQCGVRNVTISSQDQEGNSYPVIIDVPIHALIKKADYYANRPVYTEIIAAELEDQLM